MRAQDRVARLEARAPARAAPDDHSAQTFWARIQLYVDRFTSPDVAMTLADLLNLSAAEHFAWSLRFERPATNLRKIFELRGLAPPPFYADGDEHL